MKKRRISKDWELHSPGFHGRVDLPNDYAVTMPRSPRAEGRGDNGYFGNGNGYYRKALPIDPSPRHYILDLDGAYMCATVKCNDYVMVTHPHGYTPILVDLTKRLRFGEVNHLNSIKKEKFSDFWYVDSDGIGYDEAVARVRRFNKGNRVLLKYYRYKSADTSVTLSEKITKATAYTADEREYALEFSGNSVCLPKEKVALILIETESL